MSDLRSRRVLAFTGAGTSAESGLATFRDPAEGLWARFDPYELATPQAWESDRALVWAWYEWRRAAVLAAEPNPGHRALAAAGVPVVTQNVDDLHERAGSTDVLHLHGSLGRPRCDTCAEPADVAAPVEPLPERLEPPPCASTASCRGHVRPGVVWFGEAVRAFDDAIARLDDADVLLVVGTSGLVHPAAGLVDLALGRGLEVVVVDPSGREVPGAVTVVEPAGVALPRLLGA